MIPYKIQYLQEDILSWNPSEENRKSVLVLFKCDIPWPPHRPIWFLYDLKQHLLHASYLIRHLKTHIKTAEIGLSSFLLHSPLLASLAIVDPNSYTISLVVRCHAAAALEQMWRDIFDAWATAWFKSWWRLCRRGIHCGSGWCDGALHLDSSLEKYSSKYKL